MSQIIRATRSPDVPVHGKMRNVARSGRRYMSDSSMRTKPSIDDPSNMILPSSASSNWRSGISTFLIVPRMSVNCRRMNLTFSLSIRDVMPAEAGGQPPRGVLIDEVRPDSPADKGGMKRGDVVVEFDGEHVRSARQFSRLVQESTPGRSVTATVVRDGQRRDLQIT